MTDTLNSSSSEAYVIAALMSDPNTVYEALENLTEEHFQSSDFRLLFNQISDLAHNGQPFDLASLLISKREISEKIGSKKLFSVQQVYMGSQTVLWHIEKLKEMHLRRTILRATGELRKRALDVGNTTLDELRSDLEQTALSLDSAVQNSGLKNGLDPAYEWMNELSKRRQNPDAIYGMVTGFHDLDKLTFGWQRGDLIIVGGRTSVGKSAFAIENLVRVASRGYQVALFSMEMSAEQVRNRIAANITGVGLSQIRTGRMDDNEFAQVSNILPALSLVAIDDSRGISTDYITAEMKRFKRVNGLDFVVVDYIQEIIEKHQPNDNTGSALARVARKLRKAADVCDCAVMVLSQLNRDAEGKKPSVKDLSGSSGIESAADVVVLLHRDKEESPKMLEVDVQKQRNGKQGLVNLYYDLMHQRLQSIAAPPGVSQQ